MTDEITDRCFDDAIIIRDNNFTLKGKRFSALHQRILGIKLLGRQICLLGSKNNLKFSSPRHYLVPSTELTSSIRLLSALATSTRIAMGDLWIHL